MKPSLLNKGFITLKTYGLILLFTIFGFAVSARSHQGSDPWNTKADVLVNKSAFIKNSGEHPPECLFYSKTQCGYLYLLRNGDLVYSRLGKSLDFQKDDLIREAIVDKKYFEFTEGVPNPLKVSHFTGRTDPVSTITSTAFQTICCKEITDGISLELAAQGSSIEKRFYIKPGAKTSDLMFSVENAELSVDPSGKLIISSGESVLNYSRPMAYQTIKDKIRIVDVDYFVQGSKYGFTLGDYEKSLPLVIDPLLGGTYAGNKNYTYTHALDIDKAGNIFITGCIQLNPGDNDVFILKFNNDLTQLLAENYLYGDSSESATDIVINQSGEVYITGFTKSPDFPVTNLAFQQTKNDSSDIFIARFNNNLDILSSTFFGGNRADCYLYSVLDVAPNGNIYLGSDTRSTDIPMVGTPYQSYNAGYEDGLIAVFNPALTNLIASTYLGGMYSEGLHALHLDNSGNVMVGGHTWSSNFPHTSGSISGIPDAYISKLDGSLSTMQASVFLGGSAVVSGSYTWEGSLDIATDNLGNIFLAGRTMANDFQPITPGSFQSSFQGYMDAFITKFDPGLNVLRSTFFGGSGSEVDHESFSIAIDHAGFVWVAGATTSKETMGFPLINTCYSTIHQGFWDGFISKLDQNLNTLYASTYYGGNENEVIQDIKIDPYNHVFVCGNTNSIDLPTTFNAFSTALSGSMDAFIAKFDSGLTKYNLSTEEQEGRFSDAVLLTASPNPASQSSLIGFSVPDDCYGELFITDMTGRRLKTVIQAFLKKNSYTYQLTPREIETASQPLLIHLSTNYKGKAHLKTIKLVLVK